ncbi:hypothetical protein IC235_06335 [Hymenobacter sp. BT664]|uniref:T9SS type A sorting domain-containing protein n=1 Tax=Hymenobacter montanus TaxID=2771359 RepID=A0A927BCD4_9BACT|nr:choice-of-anchor Q domain-containing protein [Hymenobacter montanus]MBD2767508.1 hypothetical protein [Hymenobacter montanus]
MKRWVCLSLLLLGWSPAFAATFTIANGDVAGLAAAINAANTNNQADIINLATNGTYVFTTINNIVTDMPDPGYIETEGPVALPVILGEPAPAVDLIINLNGSVLRRSSAAPLMRLLQGQNSSDLSWQLNGGTIRDFESPADNPLPGHGGGGGAVVVGISNTFSSESMTFENCTSNSLEERSGAALQVGGASQITLRNSTYRNNTGTSYGGAVTVLGSDVRIENCVFDHNTCTEGGGAAVYVDGLRKTSGDNFTGPGGLGEIIGCTFTNNTAPFYGAVFLQGYNLDQWVVRNCQFTNNTATKLPGPNIPGGKAGGLWHNTHNNGRFEVSNCTFENNEAREHGGGVGCGRGDNKFINCTFYGNKTFEPGGLGGALYQYGNENKAIDDPEEWFTTIVNCTFANNMAGGYGGAWSISTDNGAIRGSVQNTIIANNRAYQQCGYPVPPDCVPYNNAHNCGSILNNNGNNIEYPERNSITDPNDTPCFPRPVVVNSNTMPVIDPRLSPPASNGGPTRTMALQANSPAINAGSGCPATDQRGLARVGACDIGAYEFSTPLPVELAAFSVVARGGVAHLSWRTASETSNAGFGVEVSSDGQQFRRLGWVAGQGSRPYPTDYTFADPALPSYAGPLVYYRLQQIDEGGTGRFSPVRSVSVPVSGALGLQLWPNPARQRVRVGGVEAGQAVRVYDLSGRLVLATTAPVSGPSELELPAGLPRGSYLVRAGVRAGRLVLE